jgi:hypothetical protein
MKSIKIGIYLSIIQTAFTLIVSFALVYSRPCFNVGDFFYIFPTFNYGSSQTLIASAVTINKAPLFYLATGIGFAFAGLILFLLREDNFKKKFILSLLTISIVSIVTFHLWPNPDYILPDYRLSSKLFRFGLLILSLSYFFNTANEKLKIAASVLFACTLGALITHFTLPFREVNYIFFHPFHHLFGIEVFNVGDLFSVIAFGYITYNALFTSVPKIASSINGFIIIGTASLGVLLSSCDGAPKNESTEQTITYKKDSSSIHYNPLRTAYYGDLHLHTSWSFDAFINGVRTTPDDAYMHAKGFPIDHVSGKKIRINKPLDFLAVTDHSEYMGVFAIAEKDRNSAFAKIPVINDFLNASPEQIIDLFTGINRTFHEGKIISELDDKKVKKSVWDEIIAIANKHYEPGKFTTFAAYEWTAGAHIKPSANMVNNLHRCIIYKDKPSEIPYSSLNSPIPDELWNWMENERAKEIEILAIPHNGNISNGLMYGPLSMRGVAIDKEHATKRRRNEPINEVTQAKGQSMEHPELSPSDEFANFEMYEYIFNTEHGGNGVRSEPKGSYVREAFKDGLIHEKRIGVNPFKFGVIGSSDSHNSAGFYDNNNYHGKLGVSDATAKQRIEAKSLFGSNADFSASGIAGVWAESNTREAIFAALQRKETFATSGPRISIRFFGGWNISDSLIENENWVKIAYQNLACMGSDLKKRTGNGKPSFVIHAIKDVDGATLDRLQIIKGWLDVKGNTHEKVYDVAWSGARTPDANGKIAAVVNTVSSTDLSYDNATGKVEFKLIWKDPDFNENENAFYYARVLEIPTPHWKSYDYLIMKKPFPNGKPIITQERAWSSPIWYTRDK